tara:strand:- start:42 stop:221 length:180 start_codon:yes stop_codon:yes gene_type:complete
MSDTQEIVYNIIALILILFFVYFGYLFYSHKVLNSSKVAPETKDKTSETRDKPPDGVHE